MKKNKNLPWLLLIFILFSAFSTFMINTNEYETSDITDLSFGERLIYHGDEMYALENYYLNVANNAGVVNDYNSLMFEFANVIQDQKDYMEANNITFEQVRQDPSILPVDFHISDLQYSRLNNVINSTLPIATSHLEESLNTLDEYIDLARQVDYTPREIIRDANGPIEEDDDGNFFRKSGKKNRGLKSREAVRKLKDLLKKRINLSPGQIHVYPNPVSDNSNISFINGFEGEATISMFDMNGKKIKSNVLNLEKGTQNLKFSEIFENEINSGVYFLRVTANDGKVFSKKVIIN